MTARFLLHVLVGAPPLTLCASLQSGATFVDGVLR